MPFVEQLLYGVNIADASKGNQVLAHSPGIGKDAEQEIIKLCEGWGPAPVLGLPHSALMSFPIESSMASLRGNLYAIIRVSEGMVPLFHAMVINDADYTTYGHHPFALAAAFPFEGTWSPGQSLARIQLKSGTGSLVITPLPSPEDIGIVDLIIEQTLVEGRTLLPLEQASAKSDRTLALVLAAMPKSFLRNLRFSSFSNGQANNYTLAAVQTSGSAFVGWKRLLLTKVLGKIPAQKDSYVRKVRALLEVGDLDGLRILDLQPQSQKAPLFKPQPKPQAKPKAEIVTPGAGARISSPARSSRSPQKITRTVSPRKMPSSKRPARSRRGDLNFSRLMMLVLGVALVGSGGIWWSQQYGVSGLEAWSGLPGFTQNEKSEAKAQTLLEVVDSGKVYDKLVGKLAHASLGQGKQQSRDRFKALETLQSDAAVPLVGQTRLFLKLAGDGIQQSSRQDREVDRLTALASQGAVLESELMRLELAWISLSSGVDWRDLGHLSDRKVSARRDSLGKKSAHSLETAGLELGTSGLVKKVSTARVEAEGMADLLDLFRAQSWTANWEDALPRAAKKVSPSASKMTRAYRNSAYALVRLKEAERATLLEGKAFSETFGTEAWLPYDVVELLPSLRRQVGRFSVGGAPEILAGTLSMYAALQKSAKGETPGSNDSAELVKLDENEALHFDPAVYGDLVERIRFEAARYQLAKGANPADLPDVYFSEGDRDATIEFMLSLDENLNKSQWQELADTSDRAFFRRWAHANSKQAELKQLGLIKDFDTDWIALKQLAAVVSTMATEGNDWTAHWHDLQAKTQSMQEKYPPALAFSSEKASVRIQLMGTMARRLAYGGTVDVTGVVVRLGQDSAASDNKVIVKLAKADGSPVGTPYQLQLGPAAPAGSGWVGTGNLDWKFSLGQDETLVASVLDAVSGEVLQEISYDSLQQRVGCGALSRTSILDNGSLSFKMDPGYWRGLEIPEFP